MSSRIWGTDTTLWSAACWPWGECVGPIPVVEVGRPGVDATTLIQPWMEEEQWNPYRAGELEREKNKQKKKLVELICKVKGVQYDSKKEVKNFTLSVDEMKMVVKQYKDIQLEIK